VNKESILLSLLADNLEFGHVIEKSELPPLATVVWQGQCNVCHTIFCLHKSTSNEGFCGDGFNSVWFPCKGPGKKWHPKWSPGKASKKNNPYYKKLIAAAECGDEKIPKPPKVPPLKAIVQNPLTTHDFVTVDIEGDISALTAKQVAEEIDKQVLSSLKMSPEYIYAPYTPGPPSALFKQSDFKPQPYPPLKSSIFEYDYKYGYDSLGAAIKKDVIAAKEKKAAEFAALVVSPEVKKLAEEVFADQKTPSNPIDPGGLSTVQEKWKQYAKAIINTSFYSELTLASALGKKV
jgi:hypothetical protein